MKKTTALIAIAFWVHSILLADSDDAEGMEYINHPAALLITRAQMDRFEEGTVAKLFDRVQISRDPIRKKRGFLILDATTQQLLKTQIPLEIDYGKSIRKGDGKSYDTVVKPESFSYGVAPERFMGLLRGLLAAEKSPLPAEFNIDGPLTHLNHFESKKALEWFLISGKYETVAKDPATRVSSFHPTPEAGNISYNLRLGDRAALEDLHSQFTKDAATAARNIYHTHYDVVPLKIQIYKLLPGLPASNPAITKSIYVVRHRRPTISWGKVLIPAEKRGAEAELIHIESVSHEGLAWNVKASPESTTKIIKRLVLDRIREMDPEIEALNCVLPEDEEKTIHSCRQDDSGKIFLEGDLSKKMRFVLEEALKKGESAEQSRPLYRVVISTTQTER